MYTVHFRGQVVFVTHRNAEQRLCGGFGNDHQSWHFVEQSIHSPWFYVSWVSRLGEGTLVDTLMIGDIPTLEDFLAQSGSESWIDDVQLVSPGWLNGTGKWLMEPLTSLTENCVLGVKSYRYVVRQSATYSCQAHPVHPVFSKARLVYSA